MDKDKFNAEVGRRISSYRAGKEMSAEQLAEDAGISPQTLGRIEGGRRACKTTTFYGICKALGVSSDYILGFSGHDAEQDIVLLLSQLTPKEKMLVEQFIRNLIDIYHK